MFIDKFLLRTREARHGIHLMISALREAEAEHTSELNMGGLVFCETLSQMLKTAGDIRP